MMPSHRLARSFWAFLLVAALFVVGGALTFVLDSTDALTAPKAGVMTPAVRQPPSTGRAPQHSELNLILERAADYAARFFDGFSAAAAEEERVQTYFTDSPRSRRVLRSDLLLVRSRENDHLMAFHDVFELNGKRVRAPQERLRTLFLDTPATAMADASRITAESARYDIVPIGVIGYTLVPSGVTVNVPTFPLQFLERRNQTRFTFRKGRQEIVDGLRVWRVDYSETTKPTLIRTRAGEDVRAEGAFWIDDTTGTVVRTRLQVEVVPDPAFRAPVPPPQPADVPSALRYETYRPSSLHAEFVVTYRANDALGVWMPAEMKETYLLGGGNRTDATTNYSAFRRVRDGADETAKAPK